MRACVAVLVVAAALACSGPLAGGEGCPTNQAGAPPQAGGPGSGAGSATVTPHTAAPAATPSPPVSAPTPFGGRLLLTAADDRQTVTVAAGTFIEVRLEPTRGTAWTVPESSDARSLPRLSASGGCDGVAEATFRAAGPGEITATRPSGDAVEQFRVDVRVAG